MEFIQILPFYSDSPHSDGPTVILSSESSLSPTLHPLFLSNPLPVLIRLGVIEEEREEDEKKLNVAVAAATRMSQLVRPSLLLQLLIN